MVMMKTVDVCLTDKNYQIYIGPDLLKQVGFQLRRIDNGDKVVIVTNPMVKQLYGKFVEQSLIDNGFNVKVLEVPGGEDQKSLQNANRLYGELNDN